MVESNRGPIRRLTCHSQISSETVSRRTASACLLSIWLLVAGCSDNNDGNRNVAVPPPLPNTTTITAALSADEVVDGSAETGTAAADFTINLDDETISGTVTLTGVTATGVSLRVGFAGEAGTELIALVENSATEWEMPASAAFSAVNLEALEAGEIFIQVTTAAEPDGALRAQLVRGNVELLFVEMTGEKSVPPVATVNRGKAAITYNPDTGDLEIHLNTDGLDDAAAVHVHNALAGLNGPIAFELMQDPNDDGHWFTEGIVLAAAEVAEYEAGSYYLNLHTPANPPGEVRGQIVPPGVEVVYTDLTAANVVPPSNSADSGVAASTIVSTSQSLAINVYLNGPADADSVSVHQAPAGQNGPTVYALAQDPNNLMIWSVSDDSVSNGTFAALENKGLYVEASSPGFPSGALRGQIETADSDDSPAEAFLVDSVIPADSSTVGAMPNEILIDFNRSVLEASVVVERFELERSGGDGSFGDGNEVAVNIAATSVSGSEVALDLTGAAAADDVYQLTVDGSGTGITDEDGILLDGDADGAAGGDYLMSFTVNTAPTFTQVQAVFTQSCAFSGCHGGANPAQGMNLSQGQAFADIVNVPSNQMPSLDRIEPGNPNDSYLVRKIEGTGSFARMPAGGAPPLDAATIQLIRDWVSAGAPNN